MIDLHTHSLFSDGSLLPAELAQRALVKGVEYLAITDHVDPSNLDFVIPRIIHACEELNKYWPIKIIPGIELTHIPPETIDFLAKRSRTLGAKLILVHGETLVEPVPLGTNLAALKAEIDILAHPGLITEEEIALAKERSILLEITARKGHSLTNGHVAAKALKAGVSLVFNTDSHDPEDLVDETWARNILLGAGLSKSQAEIVFQNGYQLAQKVSQ
jgi:histidinol phosphatase-like PHP family hydrolase